MMLSDAASDAKPGSKLVSVCISTRSIFVGSAAWHRERDSLRAAQK